MKTRLFSSRRGRADLSQRFALFKLALTEVITFEAPRLFLSFPSKKRLIRFKREEHPHYLPANILPGVMLVIGDSLMSRLTCVPPGFVVVSLSGARLSHVIRYLREWNPVANPRLIILAVGVNDRCARRRESADEHRVRVSSELREAKQLARRFAPHVVSAPLTTHRNYPDLPVQVIDFLCYFTCW